jgi:hypothetical protein
MNRLFRLFQNLLTLMMFLGIAGYVIYSRLDESHKRFVQNFVKQIPELPGRYAI